MDRREFLKNSAVLTAATLVAPGAVAAQDRAAKDTAAAGEESGCTKLITSAPMLQNFAQNSMGVAFGVSGMANGFVNISENPDMSGARTVKCGGYRVTDMNPDVMLVRLTDLKPSTRYYYTIGADSINYIHGHKIQKTGTETDPRVYSFVTAGKKTEGHFCVINDTHLHWDTMQALTDKIAELAPSCVIWNGDASSSSETIDVQKNIFINPPIERKDYAAEMPYLLCPGNHDSRGLANRHLEKVWMFRQPEERSSRDWDLGRNFAVRVGDIALIGLDTAEDKVDTNPKFAGLFNSSAYREAQVAWLEDALKRKEIAKAPFLVALCHIPLFDDDPTHNPGDVMPDDHDPQYSADFAYWQRTCAKLWGPLLDRAKCQLVVTGHMHEYRYDAATRDRRWAQVVGGGPDIGSDKKYPTVIEGKVEGRTLKVTVHNIKTGKVQEEFTFKAR